MNTKLVGEFNELPTREFQAEIVRTVDENQAVILTAETGAGKSTQVPQYLAEHGYERVIVTQPRILAARNLSRRVREEWTERTGEDGTEIVGYRTAHERDDSGRTKILYCTDGLQLVREITGIGTSACQVLVLDEVHEWNENMEVLVAWSKKRMQEDPNFRVVIMSATIEVQSLADFYDTDAIIEVPGRYHAVEKRHGSDVLSELFTQLENPGRNILTFLPGKTEIQDVMDALSDRARRAGVPIIPLHSQLEAEMQQQAFANYPHGKIILATNIAQTSVTIDDIDLVIDSGLERRSEVRSGVEGLFLANTSQADCLQRAGRAGRTKPGEYILCAYDTFDCPLLENRPEYPVPEILRTHLDRLALRLAAIGLDIESLDFYHDPSHRAIKNARRLLVALGALSRHGEITNIGRAMEAFPVSSRYGRMLVEAQNLSQDVRRALALVIAIAEVGGIIKGGTRYTGWRKFTTETSSDMLAQLEVFDNIRDVNDELWAELGVLKKATVKVEEVAPRLGQNSGVAGDVLSPRPLPRGPEKELLLKAIMAGYLDSVWKVNYRGEAVNMQTKKRRELSSSSVVKNPRLIVGEAFDLEIPTPSGGRETLHLVQMVTKIKPRWLQELAPKTFAVRPAGFYYDPKRAVLKKMHHVRVGGREVEISGEKVAATEPDFRQKFIEAYSEWVFSRIGRGAKRSQSSARYGEVAAEVRAILGATASPQEMTHRQRAEIRDLIRSYEAEFGRKRAHRSAQAYRSGGKKTRKKAKYSRHHRRDRW